jgi:hypothetical protein
LHRRSGDAVRHELTSRSCLGMSKAPPRLRRGFQLGADAAAVPSIRCFQ